MKVPRPFVTKLSLATVLAVSASLGWATPEATAGTVQLIPVGIIDQTVSGDAFINDELEPNPQVDGVVSGGSKVSVAAITFAYGFAVKGPATAQAVNLDITFSAGYTLNNLIHGQPLNFENTQFMADVEVIYDSNRVFRILTGESATSATAEQVVSNGKVEIDAVAPNVGHSVILIAEVSVSDFFDDPKLFGAANIDPVISFAPGFDSTGYSLEFSPGVGNEPDSGGGTAIPEPSTLVLSSIVFGMWGVVWAYRQRQRARPAA